MSRNIISLRTPNDYTNRLRDILILTKARVNLLVIATTFVGFALNIGVRPNWLLLLNTLLGTGLIAGGAAAANQTLEWPFDQKMIRTQKRPIAAGRFASQTGIAVSAIFLVLGCLWLGMAVNLRAMLVALLTFFIYVFVYTPMKRFTPACTLAGAIAGALPVLIGWAATETKLGLWVAIAFSTLFLWQVPHFLAIAWWFRADYARGGYHVLPHDDQCGFWTAGVALFGSVITVAISLLPAWLHRVSGCYLWCGAGLGIMLLSFSLWFFLKRSGKTARGLFIASLLYLPFIYILMLVSGNQ